MWLLAACWQRYSAGGMAALEPKRALSAQRLLSRPSQLINPISPHLHLPYQPSRASWCSLMATTSATRLCMMMERRSGSACHGRPSAGSPLVPAPPAAPPSCATSCSSWVPRTAGCPVQAAWPLAARLAWPAALPPAPLQAAATRRHPTARPLSAGRCACAMLGWLAGQQLLQIGSSKCQLQHQALLWPHAVARSSPLPFLPCSGVPAL